MARASRPTTSLSACFGDSIGGVEGVYNRHSYLAEKTDALQGLATLM
jgi:hypothetical protein